MASKCLVAHANNLSLKPFCFSCFLLQLFRSKALNKIIPQAAANPPAACGIECCMYSIPAFLPSLFACLIIFSGHTQAMAKDTWTISQTTQIHSGAENGVQTRLVVYEVSDYASSIVNDEESVFIDYDTMHLYRRDKKSSTCRVFPLYVQKQAGNNDIIVAANVRELMGEIVARENGKKQRINGVDCFGKDVLFGAGLLRMKRVAPIKVKYLGQSFVETTGEYWLSSSPVELFEEKIKHRQTAFSINPLLKRIDPLGLIGALGGIPIQGEERSKGRHLRSTLVSGPVSLPSTLTIPKECRAVILGD
jgi:hypothetical protein